MNKKFYHSITHFFAPLPFLSLAYFIILGILWNWPLPLVANRAVAGRLGDNLQYIWEAGWFKKALLELHISPYTAPDINYPEGWSLVYTDPSPAMLTIALPATIIGGETLGYHFAMLVAFVLTGWGTYMWVQCLSRDLSTDHGHAVSAAGLIAGTIFACSPFRQAHFLAGHLNIVGTQWFPFYFWGLFDLLQLQVWKWRPILMASISLGLIAHTSQYYLFMALLATVLIIPMYVLFFGLNRKIERSFWKRLIIFALIAFPGVLLGLLPFIQAASQGGMPDRSLPELSKYSAPLEDFFLPASDHFLWGNWVSDHFNRLNWIEGTLYLGAVACLLALFSLFARRYSSRLRETFGLLIVLGIGFMILALGTDLNFFNQPIYYPPIQNFQLWLEQHGFSVTLPGTYMIQYLPFYAKMRAWSRFSVLTMLTVSVLAGMGSAWLFARCRKRVRLLLVVLLLSAVFIDFYPGVPQEFSFVKPREVDAWLAAQPGKGAVVQLPFELALDQEFTFYTLYHKKPFISGPFTAFPTPQYLRIKPVLGTFPSLESVSLLQALGVQYVVIQANEYGDFGQVQTELNELGLPLLVELNGDYVYQVR